MNHSPAPAETFREHIRLGQLMGLAWPIIVSMLSFTTMAVVDTLFVAQLGTAQLASMGLSIATLYVVHGFGDGLLTGLKVVVAQRTGAGDNPAVERMLWLGLWLAVGMGLAEAALYPLSEAAFVLQQASPEVTAHSVAYFEVRVLGAPLGFGMYALSAWLQGRGDTRAPMMAMVVANIANVGLDPLLIFGLGSFEGLGVAGAAVASVCAQAVGLAYLLWRLRRTLATAPRRFDGAALKEVWRVGAPLGVRLSLHVASFAVFSAILAQVGDAHLAAHILVVRLVMVSFLPGMGIGEACSILVGQLIGAKRYDLIAEVRRHGLRVAAGIMLVCGVLFIATPVPLVMIFDPAPEVLAMALDLMIIAAAFQLFDAVVAVYNGVLNGSGDTRFVMLAGVATQWFVMLPIGWALAVPGELGAVGAWLGLTAEILAAAALVWWRVGRQPWLPKEPRPRRTRRRRVATATVS